jgi:hypothetical protein
MSIQKMFYCDRKGCYEATIDPSFDRWWKYQQNIGLHFYPWDFPQEQIGTGGGEILHLCSADCVQRVTAKFLEERSK